MTDSHDTWSLRGNPACFADLERRLGAVADLERGGEFTEALALLDVVERDFSDQLGSEHLAFVKVSRGQILSTKGEWLEASDALAEALRLGELGCPDYPHLMVRAAWMRSRAFAMLERYPESETAADVVLELSEREPDHVSQQFTALALSAKAWLALKRNHRRDRRDAARIYRSVIQRFGDTGDLAIAETVEDARTALSHISWRAQLSELRAGDRRA